MAESQDLDPIEKEIRIGNILNDTETYMQGNMNAIASNMSMLTLHSFELGLHVQRQSEDFKMQERIIKNVETHCDLIKKKSAKTKEHLKKLA